MLRVMAVLPVSLEKDTIVECVFEMRFSAGHSAAAELLPGLVFGKLPQMFKSVVTMPLGLIPKAARDQNPQFRYVPTQALEGPNVRMMFGAHVVGLSFSRPYAGWAKVEPQIRECMSGVFDTKMTGNAERFSLKYVNLLQQGRDELDLMQTKLRLELGSFAIRGTGTSVKAEIERDGCVSIVEIQSGATVSAAPGHPAASGVLLNVDTQLNVTYDDPRAVLPHVLEKLHNTEKEIFFGLLTESTLKQLGPRYAQTH